MKKIFNLSLAIIMAFCCLLTGCSFESTEEPSLDKFVAPASVMTSWGQTTIVDNGTEKYIEKEISGWRLWVYYAGVVAIVVASVAAYRRIRRPFS